MATDKAAGAGGRCRSSSQPTNTVPNQSRCMRMGAAILQQACGGQTGQLPHFVNLRLDEPLHRKSLLVGERLRIEELVLVADIRVRVAAVDSTMNEHHLGVSGT